MKMQFKYFKGSKFFQRHWVVNTIINEAKKAGVFSKVEYGELNDFIRPRLQKELNKVIICRRMWKFVQPFIDDCMEKFNIPYIHFTFRDFQVAYFGKQEGESEGFFGKHISKSEYKKVPFLPYLHETYGLIKQIFKQHYDSKSV